MSSESPSHVLLMNICNVLILNVLRIHKCKEAKKDKDNRKERASGGQFFPAGSAQPAGNECMHKASGIIISERLNILNAGFFFLLRSIPQLFITMQKLSGR